MERVDLRTINACPAVLSLQRLSLLLLMLLSSFIRSAGRICLSRGNRPTSGEERGEVEVEKFAFVNRGTGEKKIEGLGKRNENRMRMRLRIT